MIATLTLGDAALVAMIVAAVAGLVLTVSGAYCASRVWDLRREHQERLAQANAEIVTARDMIRRREIRDRVMGSVPVSRVIEDHAGDGEQQ